MMKEILYRAKAINRDPNMNYRTNYQNGDWVYGLVSRLDEYSAEMTNTDGVSGIDVDRNTICEYTGLTDKNCNKIFEGDIVKVKWNDGDGDEISNGIIGYDVKNGLYHIRLREYCSYVLIANHPEIVVIGNIFDNPNL